MDKIDVFAIDEDSTRDIPEIRRGDILLAEYFFNGSWRLKPVLIVQNDIGNKVSPLLIVVPIVTSDGKGNAGPMQIDLDEKTQAVTGLRNSSLLLNIILTIEKKQLKEKIGRIPNFLLPEVEKGLRLSLGLTC